MNIPAELKYTKDHEWVKIEGDTAIVGITDFAQSDLGDIVFVDVDSVDEELKAGEVLGSVEAVKTVSDLYYKALEDIKYKDIALKKLFKEIHFAVLDHSANKYNFNAFLEYFGDI